MPAHLDPAILREAEAAVKEAQEVRAFHRKRSAKDNQQRRHDLTLARRRLKEAMRPLKREIGRFQYGPQTSTAERNREAIRLASEAIQKERRKLWKMLQRKDT